MQKSSKSALLAIAGNFNQKPSATCMQELAAFSGPLPGNHYVHCEHAKAAILHLQATATGNNDGFNLALAKAMEALNNLTPYL